MQIQVQYTAPLTEFTGKRHESVELRKGAAPLDIRDMLEEYYSLRGWDMHGVPTPERLAALGLSGAGRPAGGDGQP